MAIRIRKELTLEERAERDREIIKRRKEGALFRELGAEFGITRERARQIVNNWHTAKKEIEG